VLIYIYLFSLIVGAVLLGASILLGGQDADADGDLDADADADGGLDKDIALDKDVGGAGDAFGFLTTFLSLRFWTFFLAFFGLTGLVLDLFGLVGSWIALVLALAMGLGTGAGAMAILRALAGETSGSVVESRDYVGKTARVVVPFRGINVGKVRVDVKGTSIDLLASGVDEDAYGKREEVLIVEMEGSRARVARVDGRK